MAGRTIILQPGGRKDAAPANAGGVIFPGMLVELNSSGKVIPHATADGFGARAFALEDALIGLTVDDAYPTADEEVGFLRAEGCAKLNLLCEGGQNFPAGTKLASAGDGTLQPAGAGTKQVFATVRVGADLTGLGATLLECDIH